MPECMQLLSRLVRNATCQGLPLLLIRLHLLDQVKVTVKSLTQPQSTKRPTDKLTTMFSRVGKEISPVIPGGKCMQLLIFEKKCQFHDYIIASPKWRVNYDDVILHRQNNAVVPQDHFDPVPRITQNLCRRDIGIKYVATLQVVLKSYHHCPVSSQYFSPSAHHPIRCIHTWYSHGCSWCHPVHDDYIYMSRTWPLRCCKMQQKVKFQRDTCQKTHRCL